jgi:hypothetical protein
MLSKINAWIVERIAKSAGDSPTLVALGPSGLTVRTDRDQRVVSWAAVKRIVAYTRPGGIGDTMCLALEIEGGGVLELGENATDWDRVADQLGGCIPLAMSPNEWKTRLLAEPSSPVTLYEDPAGKPAKKDP